MKKTRQDAPWYAAGLRFSCQQCHNCCRGAQPGWVYLSQYRIGRIAALLGIAAKQFRRRFVTNDEHGDKVLKLRPNGDCIFWRGGCTIYKERPRQCRTFPFWNENLGNRGEWQELKAFCPGIGKGKLYPLQTIRAVFKGRGTAG